MNKMNHSNNIGNIWPAYLQNSEIEYIHFEDKIILFNDLNDCNYASSIFYFHSFK